jgi:hypothetical protein
MAIENARLLRELRQRDAGGAAASIANSGQRDQQ